MKAFEAAERQIKEQKKQRQLGARLARLHKERVGRLTCQDNHIGGAIQYQLCKICLGRYSAKGPLELHACRGFNQM